MADDGNHHLSFLIISIISLFNMQKQIQFCLATALMLLLFISCDKNEKTPLVIPATYDPSTFSANVITQNVIRDQLEAIVTAAKKGRADGVALDYNALSSLYNANTPSLKDVSTTYYAGRLDGAGNWLYEMAKASGANYTPGVTAGQGGTFGGYLFEENGLELEQLLEKGLFGAALYHHAITLMQGTITPSTVDQLLCIFGAHPDFPNTPTAANAANPDKFMANYAARRDKNDGKGLYIQTKFAFIKLQAAVKAGTEYDQERDESLTIIRENWEKINAATIINYCHSVIATMSATNPTDSDKAKALHAYGECVGFAHGWRTLPQAHKKITDAEIDQILVLLNAPYNSQPESYKFVTEPEKQLPKLIQIINLLKTKYQFSDSEVADFKKNWVAEQGR